MGVITLGVITPGVAPSCQVPVFSVCTVLLMLVLCAVVREGGRRRGTHLSWVGTIGVPGLSNISINGAQE